MTTCGESSDFSTSVMNINLKFLHMTNFSPHISFVIFATNMRYGLEVRLGRVDYFLRFGQESGPGDRRTGCLAEIGGAQYVWAGYADL